tara:strand:- start:7365 stop:8534 length:1170 start_codon:yes stop_codon:yes gene_type:complete
MKRIFNFFKLFFGSIKSYKKPLNSNILIYDSSGLDVLKEYIKQYDYYLLHVRGEEINLFCFFKSIFQKIFWKGNFLTAYINQVIIEVKPKIVITTIDNNQFFYLIKDNHKNIKTIFIQNGWRGGGVDIFSYLEKNSKFKVDYMFVFNRSIALKYKEYIKGESLLLGSLRNNHHLNTNYNLIVNSVMFISSFRKNDNNPIMMFNSKKEPISWEKFYSLDELVLSWLKKWCFENNKTLLICGRSSGKDIIEEKNWYENLLGQNNFNFLPRINRGSSYQNIQEAELIVSLGSTLGYEAFGIGKKVAFLTGRGIWLDDKQRNFGWPFFNSDKGPFWSNIPIFEEFHRLLNFLNLISDADWAEVHNKYRKELMVINPGNKKLVYLLDKLLTNNK